MSPSAAPRKYILLAWNHVTQDGVELEKEWSENLARFLSVYNFVMREEDDPDEMNDLVVVLPRDLDTSYTIDELLFFHEGLGGRRKKVLYIHLTANIAFEEGSMSDWLFFIQNAGFDSTAFTQWLSIELKGETTPISFNEWSGLFAFELSGGGHLPPTSFSDWIKDKKDLVGKICMSASLLLSETRSVATLFFAIHRIAGRFAKLEHDFMRDRSDESARKKQILSVCLGLRDAMTLSCQPLAYKRGDRILLIDDNPDSFAPSLHRILKLSTNLPLLVWNPSSPANDNPVSLSSLEEYLSVGCNTTNGRGAILENKIKLSEYGSGAMKEVDGKNLGLVLESARIILVDILLRDHSGRESERGFNVIRGLHRLCHDFLSSDRKNLMPGIIAISRADDLTTIQRALGAGASGFTLKSNLLGVTTAILAGWRQSSEIAGTARRNFRLLYTLPHGTIGLLRHVKLPSDISFHEYPNDINDKLSRAQQLRKALPFARLLAAVPKAELHIHVGSCMQPEFLVVAALVMLARHVDKEGRKSVLDGLKRLVAWTEGEAALCPDLCPNGKSLPLPFEDKGGIISAVADNVRTALIEKTKDGEHENDIEKQSSYNKMRSILHQSLGIPDYIDNPRVVKQLKECQHLKLLIFALKHDNAQASCPCSNEDILRLFLLLLASKYDAPSIRFEYERTVRRKDRATYHIDLAIWFSKGGTKKVEDDLDKLNKYFYPAQTKFNTLPKFHKGQWKEQGWPIWTVELPPRGDRIRGTLEDDFLLGDPPAYEEDRISYLLATGTRSSNLNSYLEGCELSGSEHLQHPYLVHLFAQQAVWSFVRDGVTYAELRAAISGYESHHKSIQFSFNNACERMTEAFCHANDSTIRQHNGDSPRNWLWSEVFQLEDLFNPHRSPLAGFRFPIRVNLVLTGKRHKPSREMMREAAAGIIFHYQGGNDLSSVSTYTDKTMSGCNIVGFDLAGQEDGYPPEQFRHEFERISRSHIPITAHAGENAPSGFVESAILDLRARRLGHGLALADDTRLMHRAREERICIELCPVSNFQTNQFASADRPGFRRPYPLKKFLDNSNHVCLNTDNPIISYTNMVKECFQASYAYGTPGLSLWDLLKIIRIGFVHSFLSLQERRAILEIADQILYDLFSRADIVSLLRLLLSREKITRSRVSPMHMKHKNHSHTKL